MNVDYLRKFLEPLKRRLILMLARGIVKAIDDAKGMQLLQCSIYTDEFRTQIEHPQNFGFSSNPPEGAEAFLCFPAGDRSHGIALIVEDRRYRKKNLGSGEAALYNQDGDYVWIKRGGTIEIKTSALVKIDAPSTHLTGNLIVDGTSTLTGLVTAPAGITALGGVSVAGVPSVGNLTDGEGDLDEIRNIYNTHTHPQQGGGTTSVPNQQMT